MPPSLYLLTLPAVLSAQNGQRRTLASLTLALTLALSLGRGNRFVNANNMLQQYDPLRPLRSGLSITTSPLFQTPSQAR